MLQPISLVMVTLSTVSGLGLTKWLSMHSVGIGSNVVLASGDSALAARSVEAGETLLELRSGACLTARAAYADRELGRDLQDIAARVGPGFDTVALVTLCAAERVRGFEAEGCVRGCQARWTGRAASYRARKSALPPTTAPAGDGRSWTIF